MIIFKRPECIIFDTENPSKMEFNTTPKGLLTPLNALHQTGDWEYLTEHFKAAKGIKHPVFNRFTHSYYFGLKTI